MISCESKVNAIIPQRIREARIARGMSIGDLAEKLDITRQAVSQFELGRIKPEPEKLMTIANILDLPVAFFTKPIRRQTHTKNSLKFRANSNLPIKTQEACEIHLEWAYDIYEFLNRSVVFPDLNLIDKADAFYSDAKIEDIAYELREKWELGMDPIDNLVNVVQSNGVIIAGLNLPQSKRIDAYSEWVEEVPIIMLGDIDSTAVRQRFTIAHELGHLILHYYSDDIQIDKESLSRMEKEANRFASAFLMPEQAFVKDVFSTRLESFIELKRKWGASIQSIAYRCRDLDIISDYQYTYLARRISMNDWRRNEPLDDEIPFEEPYLFKTAIEMLLDNNITTPRSILQELGFNKREIEKICFLDEDVLNVDSKIVPIQLKVRN